VLQVKCMAGCCHASGGEGGAVARTGSMEWVRLGVAAVLAGQGMAFGIAANVSPPTGVERWVLHGVLGASALGVFLLAGLPIVREAWRQAHAGRVVVEQLFLAGIAGAFGASVHATLTGHGDVYYEVVAVLVAIYTLGTVIGRNRRHAALASADRLRREFGRCVRLTCCGKREACPTADVMEGDRVWVGAGDGVPVDGLVEEGVAFVRETPMTGEPFPVVKRPGDRILAGAHVMDDPLVVRATASGGERQLDRLLGVVEAAVARPSDLQREADKIVGWFLPAVMAAAVLVFVCWTLASGWRTGLFNGLAVLVVACPCAMGLATPIGIWSGLNALAERGIAAFSGSFLERLARVDTVVFDKTGTLSDEAFSAVDFAVVEGCDREEIRAWVAAIEERSRHPVAAAFREWGGGARVEVAAVATIPGVGVRAGILSKGREMSLAVGNRGVLEGVAAGDSSALLAGLKRPAGHLHEIFVVVDGRLVAVALVRERMRDSVARARQALAEMGMAVKVMTGDRADSASVLELADCEAGLTAEEKARRVAASQDGGARVLFVGDGVNDAPAMATAFASVAMSGGAALPREVADAALYGGDLEAVAGAVRIGRRVVGGIRANLLFAAVYNLLGIGLAAGGVLHPVAAAVLMLVSSVTVSWRALRFGEALKESRADDQAMDPLKAGARDFAAVRL